MPELSVGCSTGAKRGEWLDGSLRVLAPRRRRFGTVRRRQIQSRDRRCDAGAAAADRAKVAFARRFGADGVFDPGPVTGSEDVGLFATAASASSLTTRGEALERLNEWVTRSTRRGGLGAHDARYRVQHAAAHRRIDGPDAEQQFGVVGDDVLLRTRAARLP